MNTLRSKFESFFTKQAALWFVAVLLVISLVLGVFINYQAANARQCFSQWAADTTSRSMLLTQLSSDRNQKQSALIYANSLLLGDLNAPFDKAKYLADHVIEVQKAAEFKQADAAYATALKAHPVPPAPTYKC